MLSSGTVISGNYDVTMEQGLIVSNSFGSATRYTYSLELSFMEFKPTQRAKYLNIMYPLDKYTRSLWLVSWFAVATTLSFLAPRQEKNKVCF